MSDSKNGGTRSNSSLGAKLAFGMRTSKSSEMSKRAPPVLQEVGRLAAGVIAVSSGSATGNPRNKCALQPGHSLMDWIRLGSSGKDLTGVGHRAGTLAITPRQLAEHSTPNDAWIAIRGRVYNITHYLPFHPGGPEELMRGAGRDATNLFDQVHAWVNYNQILQKCFIGRLVSADPDTIPDTIETLFNTSTSINNLDKIVTASSRKQSSIPKQTSSSAPTSPNKSNESLFKTPAIQTSTINIVQPNSITLPKFDWIQKTESVTFIFYTKSYSNSAIIVRQSLTPSCLVEIELIYDNRIFRNSVEFLKEHSVKWPCRTNINYETGKIEIIFNKHNMSIWPHFGQVRQEYEEVPISVCETRVKCHIVDKIKLTHNTYLILIRHSITPASNSTGSTAGLMELIPIGKHVRLYVTIKGQQVSRSYTPTPAALVKGFEPPSYTTDCLCLLIKSYTQGLVSSNVCSLPINGSFEISPAMGGFKLSDLERKDKFLLIAAGTGITPMLSLLNFILQRRSRVCQKVKLLFFNRTEKDILWRDQFDSLAKDNDRFDIGHILSDANEKWTGKRGRVDKTLLEESLKEVVFHNCKEEEYDINSSRNLLEDCYVCICGPSPFSQASEKFLKEVIIWDNTLPSSQIHCFLG